jgi:hypothetical protein
MLSLFTNGGGSTGSDTWLDRHTVQNHANAVKNDGGSTHEDDSSIAAWRALKSVIHSTAKSCDTTSVLLNASTNGSFDLYLGVRAEVCVCVCVCVCARA